jgi:phosphoribosylamine---glycine ligase
VNVLVVGGGGREHALAWALARSPSVDEIVCAPGNAGIEEVARCEPVEVTDLDGQVALAEKESPELVVIGPEAPLVAGLVDALADRGITAFGPTAKGARIEGSKVWAKELLLRHGVPTGSAEATDDITRAITFLDAVDPPYVIKADGLAGGKGVTVAPTQEEAIRALERALVDRAFGPAGDRVLVEEHLEGREVSLLALTDGETVVPLEPAQDFKRAGDGDTGPNTGGMGAFSPVPFVDGATVRRIVDEVIEPTVRALAAEGIVYRGVLYAGLMLTADGPRLLEYNCRFGDPETEAILPRLDADVGVLLLACAEGRLDRAEARWATDGCPGLRGVPGPLLGGLPGGGARPSPKPRQDLGLPRRDGSPGRYSGDGRRAGAGGERHGEGSRRGARACLRGRFPDLLRGDAPPDRHR